MATQQLSLGGSTSPVANTGATSSNATTQSVTSISNLSGPDAIYQLVQPNDINSIFQPSEDNSLDPFQLNPVFDKYHTSPASEAQSPGYQAYGQDWVNLIDTLSQIPRTINYGSNNTASVSGFTGNPQQLPINITSPNTTDANGDFTNQGFKQGSNVSTDIINALGNGVDFNSVANSIQPAIAAEFGLTPGSPEAQNYANAFTTYVAQANARGEDVASTDARRMAGNWEEINGKVGQAFGFAAAGGAFGAAAAGGAAAGASAAESASEAAASGAEAGASAADVASTAGDVSSAASAADAANTGVESFSDFTNAVSSLGNSQAGADASLFNDVRNVINIGGDLASHNYLGALTSGGGQVVSGIGSGVDSAYNYVTNAGTDAANAGAGIMSGISNTLGITPDTLKNVAGDLGTAGTIAGTAVPIVENALSAPTNAQLSALTNAASPASTSAVSAPALTPDAPGSALTSTELDNPNSGTYSVPTISSQTLGGGLGGPAYSQIMRELGQ